jgi:2-keto-3-deoxy-L-rhamnonate aldolase RhmA
LNSRDIARETTVRNPVKVRLAAGEPALGINVRLGRSGDIVRIAKASGHDFLFIDAQHALFNVETIGHIAQTALSEGVAAIVRVRGVDDPDVMVLLDNGVTGVVFPDVETAEDAKRAVRVARFPPIGERGVKGGYPNFDYRSGALEEITRTLNDETLVVCMIESVKGIENLEEIIAVEGVDVVHIGVSDLLYSIGASGQHDHPMVVELQDRAIALAARYGKYAGCGGDRDVERQADLIRRGMRFLTTQSDIGFLLTAATDWVAGLQQALEKPGS